MKHTLFELMNASEAPSVSNGKVICGRYYVRRTVKAGDAYQLVHVTDKIEPHKHKVVKILLRTKVPEDKIEREIQWFKEHLSGLGYRGRLNPFCCVQRDMIYHYLVFRRSPFTLMDALNDENLYIPRRHAIEIAVQMTQGLCAIHDDGTVHREVSPQSVELLDTEFVNELVYDYQKKTFAPRKILRCTKLAISFYGCTGIEEAKHPGVDQYRSPEAVFGLPQGTESDTFSLGCVIAEVLRRRPLFPPCTEGPMYKRDKMALYDTILGPFPGAMIREIHKSPDGGLQFPLFSSASIDRTISRSISQYCKYSNTLEHLFPDPFDLEVILATTKLDPEHRPELTDLLEISFFLSLDENLY